MLLPSPLGFPVLRLVSYAYMPSPGRFDGTYSLVLSPSTSAFPKNTVGRLLH
jgi:hypothetical protein